jgi:hypothetical protein
MDGRCHELELPLRSSTHKFRWLKKIMSEHWYLWVNGGFTEMSEYSLLSALRSRGLDDYVSAASCSSCTYEPETTTHEAEVWAPGTGYDCCTNDLINGRMFQCGKEYDVSWRSNYVPNSFRVVTSLSAVRISSIPLTDCGQGPTTFSPSAYWSRNRVAWETYD